MTENFVRPPSPTLHEIILKASRASETISENVAMMKASLRAVTPPPSETDRLYGASAPVAPVPAANPDARCSRVLYLHGNDRMEIWGVSEQELDAHESRLRAFYQQ